MDLAGSIYAYKVAKRRTVTVAIEAMTFRKPVFVGDVVSVYVSTVRIGRTSVTLHIAAWVQRAKEAHLILVTDGNYTYVAVDDERQPVVIEQPSAAS
jgi:acyl-CoA thioesterase YciA